MNLKMIKDLSNANGAPGYEKEVTQKIVEYVDSSLQTEIDRFNNVFIRKYEDKKPLKVLIDAHSDEVGFMIQSITSNGLLKIVPLGGWVASNVAASKVRIKNTDGEYITGVFASKPPHFMSEAEKSKELSLEQLMIDVGASDKDQILNIFKLEVGMPVIPDVEAQELLNGLLMGKAFDDRIGSCAVIDIMNEFKDVELDYNLVGSISVQEEVGTRGIKIVANKEKPDLAIVFEGTPADDAFTNKDEAQGALGKGPQIRYRDNSMVAHEGFMRYVKNIAIANDIPLQEAVRTGGGTNAGVLHLSNEGIPTIVIGVPVRHAHTHYGIINLNDYENAVKLGIKLLKTFDEEIIRGI